PGNVLITISKNRDRIRRQLRTLKHIPLRSLRQLTFNKRHLSAPGKLTPAETTEPSAGRSNSADPSAHVAVTGNVVPSGNSPASTPESTFRKLNVPSASPGSSDT